MRKSAATALSAAPAALVAALPALAAEPSPTSAVASSPQVVSDEEARLWVDINSIGGPCSDARSRDEVSKQTPWCSLGIAGWQAQPGDTVVVRAGDYTQPQRYSASVLEVEVSGLPDAWITYRAAKDEKVRIVPQGGAENGVRLSSYGELPGPAYIAVSGFEVSGARKNCVIVRDTHDVKLSNLDVSGCMSGAMELVRSARVTLESSRIHDNALGGYTSPVDLLECLDGNVIRGNMIWSNRDLDPNQSEGHGVIMDRCGLSGGGSGALIENNVIWNNDGVCVAIYHSDGAIIRNNTCYRNNNRDNGSPELAVLGAHHKIHNNILVPREGSMALRLRDNVDPAQLELNYSTTEEGSNIMFAPSDVDPPTALVVEWNGIQATVSQFQAMNGRGWGLNDRQVDPMLRDPARGDFRLLPGSPAIDSGDNGNAATIDIRGVIRLPAGAAGVPPVVDRGAYEGS